MSGGDKLLGERVAERGKGLGQEGWGKGGGLKGVGRVVEKGVGRGINRSFEQNRYRYIQFGYRNAHYQMKSAENQGVSPILEGIPL